jgi:hypothetical protein
MSLSEKEIQEKITKMKTLLTDFKEKATALTTALEGKEDGSVSKEDKAQIYKAYQALNQVSKALWQAHPDAGPDFDVLMMGLITEVELEEMSEQDYEKALPGARNALLVGSNVGDKWLKEYSKEEMVKGARKKLLERNGHLFKRVIGGKISLESLRGAANSVLGAVTTAKTELSKIPFDRKRQPVEVDDLESELTKASVAPASGGGAAAAPAGGGGAAAAPASGGGAAAAPVARLGLEFALGGGGAAAAPRAPAATDKTPPKGAAVAQQPKDKKAKL